MPIGDIAFASGSRIRVEDGPAQARGGFIISEPIQLASDFSASWGNKALLHGGYSGASQAGSASFVAMPIGSLDGEPLVLLDEYEKVFCPVCVQVTQVKHVPFTCPDCGGKCISYAEAQKRTAPRKTQTVA